jgi:hypothetical protein
MKEGGNIVRHYIPLATAVGCGLAIAAGVWQLGCIRGELKDEINSVKVEVAELAGQFKQMNQSKTAMK